jgi:hypothetical protein
MRSVICFGDLKQAALYFDRVLPIAFRRLAGTGTDIVANFPEPIPSRALINLVFDQSPSTESERYVQLGRIVDGWGEFANRAQRYRQTKASSSMEDTYEDLAVAYLQNAALSETETLRRHFADYASALGIQKAAVLLPTRGEASANDDQDFLIRIVGMELIDTSSASWDQIVEVRRDDQSRLRLQRLRSFLNERYVSKDQAFIEDDLASRLDEYDQVRRKHGFDTVTGSVSALLDAQGLQAAAAAGIATALLGGPALGVTSAVVVEIGKVALEFSKRRRAMVEWHSVHPLAYLIEMRRLSREA